MPRCARSVLPKKFAFPVAPGAVSPVLGLKLSPVRHGRVGERQSRHVPVLRWPDFLMKLMSMIQADSPGATRGASSFHDRVFPGWRGDDLASLRRAMSARRFLLALLLVLPLGAAGGASLGYQAKHAVNSPSHVGGQGALFSRQEHLPDPPVTPLPNRGSASAKCTGPDKASPGESARGFPSIGRAPEVGVQWHRQPPAGRFLMALGRGLEAFHSGRCAGPIRLGKARRLVLWRANEAYPVRDQVAPRVLGKSGDQ